MYEWFILIIFPSVLSLDYIHIKSDCCEKAENSLSMILTLLTVLILLVELNKTLPEAHRTQGIESII